MIKRITTIGEKEKAWLKWGVDNNVLQEHNGEYFDGFKGNKIGLIMATSECRSRYYGESVLKEIFPGSKIKQMAYGYWWDITVDAGIEFHIEVKTREDNYTLEYFKTNNPYIDKSKSDTIINDDKGYLLTITSDYYGILHMGTSNDKESDYLAPEVNYGYNKKSISTKVEYPLNKALIIKKFYVDK